MNPLTIKARHNVKRENTLVMILCCIVTLAMFAAFVL